MSETEHVTAKKKRSIKEILADNPLYSLAAVIAALMLPATIYMGFDLVKSELTPCETIYQQSAVGLTTKISFLETEGELQIGRRKIQELGDRAQAVALNLKTCCTVLDAGKLDAEEFLQCKAKGRDYDERIEELVALVKKAVGKKAPSATTTVTAVKADPIVTGAAAAPAPKNVKQAIAQKVDEAKAVSKKLNKQVVQVRKAQVVAQLEAIPPQNVEIDAQEREPNNDKLNTNQIELDKWISASVAQKGDWDFYVFTTPEKHRDWINIEIQNRSTGLRPKLVLYNSEKAQIAAKENGTTGGDLKHSFVAGPGSQYILTVGDQYSSNQGAYLLKVSAAKSYDSFEPNQNLLSAKEASIGTPIKASIMDGKDWDFYVFKGAKEKRKISIFLENRSTNLRPKVNLYNSSKTHLHEQKNETHGGDLDYVVEVPPGRRFFIAVSARWGSSAGDYTLSVEKQ